MMTVTEKLIEKVSSLPKGRQQEVLDFVESLGERKMEKTVRRSMQGVLAGLNIQFNESDLRKARNEMWSGYTKDTENER